MRHDAPLTLIEQSTLHDYGPAARILRGRFFGWTGERRRLAKGSRPPGDYPSPGCDSTAKSVVKVFAGESIPARAVLVKVSSDVDAADLADEDTHVELVLEMSVDGGQTWAAKARQAYQGPVLDPAGNPVTTLPALTWSWKIRAELTNGVTRFRGVLRNLGTNTVAADCAVEVDQ